MNARHPEIHVAHVAEAPVPPAGDGFRPGLEAAEVHAELRCALRALYRSERQAILWFAEIANRHLYRDLDYSSIYAYAEDALGFSRNLINRYLSVARDLERLPNLQASVATGELGWTKAQEVAKVANTRTEKRWIKEAMNSTRRELRQKVARIRGRRARKGNGDRHRQQLEMSPAQPSTDGHPDSLPRADDLPCSVTLRFTPVQLARYDALIEKIRKARAVSPKTSREDLLLEALSAMVEVGTGGSTAPRKTPVRRRTESSNYKIVICQCEVCARAHAKTSQGDKEITPAQLEAASCDATIESQGGQPQATIPAPVRRQVLLRDRYQCRGRGCNRTRFLEIHHLKPREKGGTHHLDNLVTLCSACHRLWHENGLDASFLKPVPPPD